MAPQLLRNNRVQFPKDILLHRSVHQHGLCDVICKPSMVSYDWLTILYLRLRFITRVTCITPTKANTLATAMTTISPFVMRGSHPEGKNTNYKLADKRP